MNAKRIIFFCIGIFLVYGCQETSQYSLGNEDYESGPVGIYIAPTLGANDKIIRRLQDRLEAKHGLRVVVTTAMGLSDEHYDKKRKQYISERILRTASTLADRYRVTGEKIPLIVIIPGDLNSEGARLRFVFSQHYHGEGVSVVSLARINPVSYGERRNDALLISRLEKLVNKALGYHLYHYKPSSSRQSVMYGPVMGLDDLDDVENNYP